MTPHIDDIVDSCLDMAERRVRFVHGGRSRDGVDCSGMLLLAVWENGGTLSDWPTGYLRTAHDQQLKRACQCHLLEIPVDEAGHGDVLLMWWDRSTREPQHAVLRHGEDRIVHAYEGSKRVSDVRLSKKYLRRVDAAFRFPPHIARRD